MRAAVERKTWAALGLVVAMSCDGAAAKPDLAESLGSPIPGFRSLRGVRLGRTTARSIRKSRPSARDAPYTGLVDSVPEGRIYFGFRHVADAPVSGFARLDHVGLSTDVATDSERQARFDALSRAIASKADSQPRCYRTIRPDTSESVEYRTGDLFVSVGRGPSAVSVGVSRRPRETPGVDCRELVHR
jgi:hypothetical protein